MATLSQHINATAILESLDSAQIKRRIEDLDAERRGLLTLLRAARAKERSRGEKEKEV